MAFLDRIQRDCQTAFNWEELRETVCRATKLLSCGGRAANLLPAECRAEIASCAFDDCPDHELTVNPEQGRDTPGLDVSTEVGEKPPRQCPSKSPAPQYNIVEPGAHDESVAWQLEEEGSLFNGLPFSSWLHNNMLSVFKPKPRYRHVCIQVLAEQEPMSQMPRCLPTESHVREVKSARCDLAEGRDYSTTLNVEHVARRVRAPLENGDGSSGSPCISSQSGRVSALSLGTPELKLPLASTHRALSFADSAAVHSAGGPDDAAGAPSKRRWSPGMKILPLGASSHMAPEFCEIDFVPSDNSDGAIKDLDGQADKAVGASRLSPPPSSSTMSVTTVGSAMRYLNEGDSLRAVVLAGFQLAAINTIYVERTSEAYIVNGRETYWSQKGDYMLFYSKTTDCWAVDKSKRMKHAHAGTSSGIASSQAGLEIQGNTTREGWMEWDKQVGQWFERKNAGVVRRGRVRPTKPATAEKHASVVSAPPLSPCSSAPASSRGPLLGVGLSTTSPADGGLASVSSLVSPGDGGAGGTVAGSSYSSEQSGPPPETAFPFAPAAARNPRHDAAQAEEFAAVTPGSEDAAVAAVEPTPPPVEPSPPPSSQQEWRHQLETVYSRVNSQKVKDVPGLLEHYIGREQTLYTMVCEKYGLDSSRFYATDPSAWEDARR